LKKCYKNVQISRIKQTATKRQANKQNKQNTNEKDRRNEQQQHVTKQIKSDRQTKETGIVKTALKER